MTEQDISLVDRYAIECKAGCSYRNLVDAKSSMGWLEKLRLFRQSLNSAALQGAIFDYDGTLVKSGDAYDGMRLELIQHMLRLLEAGIPIGIATGRGPSVRHEMRRCLPSRLYSRVLIGYYSGDQVGDLTQTDCPDQGASVCEELQPLLPALDHLGLIARVTLRRRQIIVEPGAGMNVSDLWRRISILLERNSLPNIRAVRSCRSVDILAPGVSKAGLLEHMRKTFRFSGPILCVGDQGSKAGNDFELLSTPYSLSVDQVSNDPETCWNLGPVGLDGVERTLYYLNQLTVDEPGILQINL